jgi:hypothetical protein
MVTYALGRRTLALMMHKLQRLYIKCTKILNLVRTTRFRNNSPQVLSKSKDWKVKLYQVFGSKKTNEPKHFS